MGQKQSTFISNHTFLLFAFVISIAGALTYHQAQTDPVCETKVAVTEFSFTVLALCIFLLCAHITVPGAEKQIPIKTKRKRDPKGEVGCFLLHHSS